MIILQNETILKFNFENHLNCVDIYRCIERSYKLSQEAEIVLKLLRNHRQFLHFLESLFPFVPYLC